MPDTWHVVFAKPHRERRAASDLCCLPGIEGFCPSVRSRWYLRGRVVNRVHPIIAGVLFARWNGSDPYLWHDVRYTDGVRAILGAARPKPILDKMFNLWLNTADDEWVVPGVALALAYLRRGYWEGSLVIINYRALRGVLGVVEKVDEEMLAARVSYRFLGRPQWRMFPLRALSAAEAPLAALPIIE